MAMSALCREQLNEGSRAATAHIAERSDSVMGFRRCFLIVGVLAALAISLPAKTEEPTAEDVLKGQGLRKLNQLYVLPDEAAVTKKFHETDALRRKVTDTQQKATLADQKVEEKKKLILDYAEKRRTLRAQMEAARSPELHNRLVTMSNELGDRMVILEKSDKEEKDATTARAASAAASEQYIELLLQLRKQYDEVEAKYRQLATDAKVQRAIDDLTKNSSKPYTLGPTASLALLDRNLRKLEAGVLSESIPLRRGEGNLWRVTVTFNEKYAQEMAIDTGASIISLPYGVAQKAGLTPTAQDQTMRASMADGRVVEAKQVFASSVRLGKFAVEHVECAVMPANLPNAEPLLGLSFLKHFTFKIDNASGKLVMARVDQAEKSGPRPAGHPESRKKTGEPPPSKDGEDQPAVHE
jgi:clan AA aspartic protease (TIGR02281 family)